MAGVAGTRGGGRCGGSGEGDYIPNYSSYFVYFCKVKITKYIKLMGETLFRKVVVSKSWMQ